MITAVVYLFGQFDPLRGSLSMCLFLAALGILARPHKYVRFKLRGRTIDRGLPFEFMTAVWFLPILTFPLFVSPPRNLGFAWRSDLGALAIIAVEITFFIFSRQLDRLARPLFGEERWSGNSGELATLRGVARGNFAPPEEGFVASHFNNSSHHRDDNKGLAVIVDGVRIAYGLSWKFRDPTEKKLKLDRETLGGDFSIETDQGTFAISTSELVWATRFGFRYRQIAVNPSTSKSEPFPSFLHAIPDGGAVVVSGKVERDENGSMRMVSHGTDPVLVAAAAAGEDPLLEIRAVHGYWNATLAGQLLVLAALLGLFVAGLLHLF